MLQNQILLTITIWGKQHIKNWQKKYESVGAAHYNNIYPQIGVQNVEVGCDWLDSRTTHITDM